MQGSSEIPKQVLKLLVYVFHPESASCINDYISSFAQFSCSTGDTWVASITLASWQVEKGEINTFRPLGKSSQDLLDSTSLCFPRDLHQISGKLKDLEQLIFRSRMSSFVISTNAFGDFSKCTIVTELIGSERMDLIVKEARELWQKFIHQPQTARCLVFLLLLGMICRELTKGYEESINKLSSVLKFNEDRHGATDEEWYIRRLGIAWFEVTRWSMDSLLKLQHNMNSTFDAIAGAKEDLIAQIRE
ncbi:hypothetical protein L207DRAFT_320963 [Hyaloscypha variabilis F]|uniref:Uncharacterized protein n=1 Tax=Hyaloscypha variabilis (strain UAMH 11265 / GT02V1 / F) TaxID=1149755 RepID=A0A2J6RRI3_HYAVF|nr:hypothetical protein L207DRAFT_320963 [Hyaloscypha variabilis F]